MSDVEEITEDIRELFVKYKQKQRVEFFHTLNNIRCCECGHQARIKQVQTKLLWYRKMTKFYQIVLAFLTLFTVLALYGLWAIRRYNHARLFGNGACISTFLWTYDDCFVSF